MPEGALTATLSSHLQERKVTLCVSTVSTVRGPCGRRRSWPRVGSMILGGDTGRTQGESFWDGSRPSTDDADGADRADGVFERPAHADHSPSVPAFTTEANVDAERPKKGLRPAQVAGDGAGIFGRAGVVRCLAGRIQR